MLDKHKEKKQDFYESIKNALVFTGTALTILAAIAYLVIVYILVFGFTVEVNSNQLIVFLALGALTGVLMNLSLRIQGIAFAKQLEESKEVMNEMTELLGKSEEKLMPIWVMFLKTILVDIIVKGGSIGLTLYFSIEIVIQGMGDSKYFWLGIVNVLLYLGLGMLSLAKAYDYYIERHIPFMKQKIIRMKGAIVNEQVDSIKRDNRRKIQRVRRSRDVKILKRTTGNFIGYRIGTNTIL